MANEAKVDGGAVVGRVLRDYGVKYCFSINGGHIFPILANLRSNDVKLIHMRHEQATAYASDGYARSIGEPGLCLVTAGCGLTNAITGLAVADLTGSAVVCISGAHPTNEDNLGSFQEVYGSDVARTFTKFTKRVTDASMIEFDLRCAFREALAPPQGPVLLEIPQNILYSRIDESQQRKGPGKFSLDDMRGAGDPAKIDRALELLLGAEKPLIAGGDGLFWSRASAELREFVELTGIPVYTRRSGQGAVPEDHPLAVRGAFKKPFTGHADVVLALGFRFWSGEHFGQPPTWNAAAKYIQVDSDPTRLGWQVNSDLPIVGDLKLVLRQMIDRARELKLDFSGHRTSPWVKAVAEARAKFDAALRDSLNRFRNEMPIHPARLTTDLVSVIDRDATVILDSFTLSGYLSFWFNSRFAGQVVDGGPLAPVGHGVGMGIGAQLARPGKQVVICSGDGGLGIGGWDMETAARYKLPIVCLLWNNSSWGPSFESMPALRGRTDSFDMLPDIQYDKIFTELGCHTEKVERPEQFTPALERALKSGKPSLLNVMGDKKYGHPTLGGNLLGSTGKAYGT